jgi:hypothetical protein
MKAKTRRTNKKFRALLTLAAAFLLIAVITPAAALEPCGSVYGSSRSFWAVRGDKLRHLGDDSVIFEFDVLETDISGAASVRFDDGSVLEMGHGTRIDVKEAVFSKERNRFNVGIAHGAARIITGKIVKLNPAGFRVTTPRGSIGVRGTILKVSVSPDAESLIAEELSPGSSVTYANKITGEKITLTRAGDSVTITVKEVTDPSTREKTVTAVMEASGEGILKGDRDARGFDRSGGGDNPKKKTIIDRRNGNDRDRSGSPGSKSGQGGDSGTDGGEGDDNGDENKEGDNG